ncbi:hypothetical protein F0919_13740 [Taibaiella lutea]|uniref:Uncharacterized protein n=1 Tax=Taibaiella lutea TaxID=2608001 RepID=A0A5M6CEU8_9BACT|nr:hypothetical protein [Taibaiella lutea]KAA5533596.1 hypothetical protein F0919_13740 [Taibaiella lutea]
MKELLFAEIKSINLHKTALIMKTVSIKEIREEVKQYIDQADDKVVKMIHAMLEVDSENDWWDSMPDNIKIDVQTAIEQADKGETISHKEIKQKFPQWFMK